MELASTNNSASKVASYFINNTVCCFNTREFCRREYIIRGWLPRDNPNHAKKASSSPSPHPASTFESSNCTHYSFYHRQRRRRLNKTANSTTGRKKSQYQSCQQLSACPLLPNFARAATHNSTPDSRRQNCRSLRQYNKFYYIKSKRAKFKSRIVNLGNLLQQFIHKKESSLFRNWTEKLAWPTGSFCILYHGIVSISIQKARALGD